MKRTADEADVQTVLADFKAADEVLDFVSFLYSRLSHMR